MKKQIVAWLRLILEWIDGLQISEAHKRRAAVQGYLLDREQELRESREDKCTHRKAGLIKHLDRSYDIEVGLRSGDDPQYAVRKHQMMNGDIWVDCLRCGKKWRPPVRENFKKKKDYLAAVVKYKEAVEFPTRNVTSSSIQLRFSRNGKSAEREITAMYAKLGA